MKRKRKKQASEITVTLDEALTLAIEVLDADGSPKCLAAARALERYLWLRNLGEFPREVKNER